MTLTETDRSNVAAQAFAEVMTFPRQSIPHRRPLRC